MVYDLKATLPQNLTDELLQIIKEKKLKKESTDVSGITNEAIEQYIKNYKNESTQKKVSIDLQIDNLTEANFSSISDKMLKLSTFYLDGFYEEESVVFLQLATLFIKAQANRKKKVAYQMLKLIESNQKEAPYENTSDYSLHANLQQSLEDELSEIIKNNANLSVPVIINEAIKQYIEKYNNENQNEYMHEEISIGNLTSHGFKIIIDQLTNLSNINKADKIISETYAQLSAEFSNACNK